MQRLPGPQPAGIVKTILVPCPIAVAKLNAPYRISARSVNIPLIKPTEIRHIKTLLQ
jgi:hypothetical protein